MSRVRALGVPVEPDAEEARRWAEEELSRSVYRDEPTLLERLWTWFLEQLQRLLELDASAPPNLVPVIVVVGAVVLLAVALYLAGPVRRRTRGARTGSHAVFDDADATSADLAAAADDAARQGDWSRAVLMRFRAIIRSLDERAVLTDRPGLTAHEASAAAAARLREAGAVIVGHTNVPPFLADYRSENEIFGRTANPWDTARTPGGSSGGAAAALAAGLTPVEVGSDLAGSLRLPPHFCGVYGLKTTEHRVAMTGHFGPPQAPNPVRILAAIGPMARDLDDLELVLRLISGPDGADVDVPPVPLGERRTRPLAGLRLAAAPELPGADVAASLRAQVSRVAAACADAGAAVASRLPDLDWGEQQVFMDLLTAVSSAFSPGAEQRTLAWYFEMLHRRDAFTAAWERFFARYDALLLPPSTTAAFTHDTADVTAQRSMMAFANLAGLPALTVPAGHDAEGLPVGLQLVGPRWSEIRLIETAAALEAAGVLPGFTPPPGY